MNTWYELRDWMDRVWETNLTSKRQAIQFQKKYKKEHGFDLDIYKVSRVKYE